MSRLMKWATPVVAFGLLMFAVAIAVKAEETKKETGTISGTVTGADGKAVAGAEVGVFHPMGKGGKKAEPKAEKGDKPVSVVPMVKTDDKGEFTLSEVPAGDYTVVARLKGQGNGRENVSVKAGETSKIEIKLKAPNKAPAAEKPKAEIAK